LFTVALTYNKSDNELSAQLQGIEPVQTLEIIKLKSSPSQHAFPWLFGILGIALIACGWFVYSYMGKYPVHIINRVDQAAVVEGDHTSDEVIYCSQCGKRAEPGELTCSNCGTKY